MVFESRHFTRTATKFIIVRDDIEEPYFASGAMRWTGEISNAWLANHPQSFQISLDLMAQSEPSASVMRVAISTDYDILKP